MSKDLERSYMIGDGLVPGFVSRAPLTMEEIERELAAQFDKDAAPSPVIIEAVETAAAASSESPSASTSAESASASADAAAAAAAAATDDAEDASDLGRAQQAAVGADGEINWDCPCLGTMTQPPCGEKFKEAFSCFVKSDAEPKGLECIDAFRAMQACFNEHPDIYGAPMGDDDENDDEDGDDEDAASSKAAPSSPEDVKAALSSAATSS